MGFISPNQELGFHPMDGVDFTDSDLAIHVRNILASVSTGDEEDYEHLCTVAHLKKFHSPDDVAILVTSLKALSGAVMYLDYRHGKLLTSIFTMNMWEYGPDVMDALIELIISLAASNGKFVDPCLKMIVDNFTPPRQGPLRGLSRKSQVISRIHPALIHIADLVPLTPMRLLPIILQKKPHHLLQEKILALYVENMLKIESGAFGGLVRSSMLAGVVDLLLDLDLEIVWDDILQEDSTKGIFDMELEDVEEPSLDLEDSDELPIELDRRSLEHNSFAEKLDNLMVLTFEHLESCDAGGRLALVFGTLFQSFQKTVLTAYKSKFTQFVMFYACALDPENCGPRFATMLEDIFVSNAYTSLIRMSAAAYIASYLARANFLSASLVLDILKRLVEWCFCYCKMQDGEIDPKAHRIFYSGCQAIMYVLCFRMKSMLRDSQLQMKLFALPLDSILTHKLSPLKVCLPSIVNEFLQQAKAANLFTTSEKLLSDNYLESEHSKAFGGMERLDMFFPFDPCLLKKSDKFIRQHFIYWSMVRPTCDDEEEGSGDEEAAKDFAISNEDVTMNNGILRNLGDFDLDDFDSALNRMSITPKNVQKFQMPSRIRPSMSPESL